jgi:hypothetical protein
VGTTTVVADVMLLTLAIGLIGLVAVAAQVGTALRTLLLAPRPQLPDDDRPPAGLGRLVPVGHQVDLESRRGVTALEMWLVSRRRG